MAFDFSATDLKSHFTIDAAAIAWCEIENLEDCAKLPFMQMRSAIRQAVQTGELEAWVPDKTVERRIGGSVYDVPEPDYARAIAERTALQAWAKALGAKPKFLFPEMRDEKRARQEETKAEIERREDKASVQAVARTLWMLFPDITAEEIANHKAVAINCNGAQWKATTLKSWIREIDPRPKQDRAGRPRKTAAENIQPQYEDVEK